MTREFEPFVDSEITRITIQRFGQPYNIDGHPVQRWTVTLETPAVSETHNDFHSPEQAAWSLIGRLARYTTSLVMVGAGGTSSMQKPKGKGEGK